MGKPWTDSEINLLKLSIVNGELDRVSLLAKLFKRSEASIKSKAKQCGAKTKIKKPRWKHKELMILKGVTKVSCEKNSPVSGRTPGACYQKLLKIKKK